MSKLRDAEFNTDYFKDMRLDRAKPKKYKKGRNRHSRLVASRCPRCGGMVVMPCVACQMETLIGETNE